MSELAHYLRPRPAYEPIRTKGNAFWRGDERFLIKGINYFHLLPSTESNIKIDPLTDENLPALKRDIHLLQELGLNTLHVSHLDPSKSHHSALKFLAEEGFYVLVKIGRLESPPLPRPNETYDQDFDTQFYYVDYWLKESLRLVDELADYPNVLGFIVNGDSLLNWSTTKVASMIRAMVRDVKKFLRVRDGGGGRRVPVGVSNSEILMLRLTALKYYTAGSVRDEGRIDFFAPNCWTWAHRSSFKISGWENMVQKLGEVPVPMLLRQFGSYVGKERLWQEIECLYSKDMTGVFSGGCLYAFHEYRTGYGIVEVDEETGKLRRKPEFETLKGRFRVVNSRADEEVFGDGEMKDYEGWVGKFPERKEGRWMATNELPEFPLEWEGFLRELREEKERKGENRSQEPQSLSSQVARLDLNG